MRGRGGERYTLLGVGMLRRLEDAVGSASRLSRASAPDLREDSEDR